MGGIWKISLQAIDPKLQDVFGEIDVEGCMDVSTIQVTHKSGDHEVISFDSGSAAAP
jgi:hypothetical protein